MGIVAESDLVDLAVKMIKYSYRHGFQGEDQEADLIGFCRLNESYSKLEKKLLPNARSLLADRWDVARNKIVTYITQKVNNRQPNSLILAEAFVMVTEPYLLNLRDKVQLRKAL